MADLLPAGELRLFFRGGRQAQGQAGGSGKSVQLELPDGYAWFDPQIGEGEIDWFIWRLVTDRRVSVTLRELETTWSLEDALHANLVLTALDNAEAKMREPKG